MNLNFDLKLDLVEYLYHNYILAWIKLFNINNQFYLAYLYILRKNRYIYSKNENNYNSYLFSEYFDSWRSGFNRSNIIDIINQNQIIAAQIIFKLFRPYAILRPDNERIIINIDGINHNLVNYTMHMKRYQIFDIMLNYISSDYMNFKTLVYAVKSKDLDRFIKVYNKYPNKRSLIDGYFNYQILASGAAAFSLPILKYILQVAKEYEFNYSDIYKRALPEVKYYLKISKKLI